MTKVGRSRGGFTLIEVLIAVVILATGMVFILQGMQTAVKGLDVASGRARGAILLRSRMSAVRAAAQSGAALSDLEPAGAFEKPYDAYRWRMKVEKEPLVTTKDIEAESDAGSLYKVEIGVKRKGRQRSYVVTTFVFVPPAEKVGNDFPDYNDGSAKRDSSGKL